MADTRSAWRRRTARDWQQYVNKQVHVTAHAQQQHRGWLLAVDPVTASVVLVQLCDWPAGCRVSVVMGHAVEEVEVLGEADPQTARRLSSLFRPEEQEEVRGGREEVLRRRAALIGWLQQNRVPVEQEGEELLVAGVLRVRPPYSRQDCLSSNHMVLDRIQALLDRMPTGAGPCDQPSCDLPSCDLPADAGQQSCDQPSCDLPADAGQQSCDQPSCDLPADAGQQSCDLPADAGQQSCDQPSCDLSADENFN